MGATFVRLEDLRLRSENLAAACSHCGHAGVVDGAKLWRWYAVHFWDGALDRISEHMRCQVCKRRPTKLEATSAEATIDFGPRTEAEWQDVVIRLRR